MADAVEEGAAPIPFHTWLENHRFGRATEEWSEELADVISAVRLLGKKGSMTIKIEVIPTGLTLVVTDSIETKIPKPDREAATYFADKTGSLVREDPNRMTMRTVYDEATGKDKLVVIDPATGEVLRDGGATPDQQ